MPRRPSKHLRPARPLGAGHASTTLKSDGAWVVRSVPGARATKPYRCPGCAQPVPPGVAHVVAWPLEPGWSSSASGVEQRRHWHTGCWQRRR